MRHILESCARVDRAAAKLYRTLAERCDDAEVVDVLERMAMDEANHTGWWVEMIDAHERGLLPDLAGDSTEMRERLTETVDAVKSSMPPDSRLGGGEALAAAAAIELFLADPVFFELLDLAGPAVADRRQDSYDRHVRRLVTAIEQRGGSGIERMLALQLKRAWRETVSAARDGSRDRLTGLSNRRSFEAHAARWLAWSARHGRALSVVLLDLDEFGAVNRLHGVAAGEAMLVAIGDAIRANGRASDIPGRYGAGSFVLLAPETGPEEARAMVDRTVCHVRGAAIATESGIVTPSVSAGIAVVMRPPDSEPLALADVLAAAGASLRAAQAAGGDRSADPAILA